MSAVVSGSRIEKAKKPPQVADDDDFDLNTLGPVPEEKEDAPVSNDTLFAEPPAPGTISYWRLISALAEFFMYGNYF